VLRHRVVQRLRRFTIKLDFLVAFKFFQYCLQTLDDALLRGLLLVTALGYNEHHVLGSLSGNPEEDFTD